MCTLPSLAARMVLTTWSRSVSAAKKPSTISNRLFAFARLKRARRSTTSHLQQYHTAFYQPCMLLKATKATMQLLYWARRVRNTIGSESIDKAGMSYRVCIDTALDMQAGGSNLSRS